MRRLVESGMNDNNSRGNGGTHGGNGGGGGGGDSKPASSTTMSGEFWEGESDAVCGSSHVLLMNVGWVVQAISWSESH